ncbi:hypothetical protein DVH24_022484 [Malus domestica]|uniref:Reticulon-like protein n=1 Tax=Malus domestica TaxID=3750 RepID=A0A498KJF8_MALDO|nr:hypothetical protein DVH24_022484 [Malus domestica]
MDKIYNHHSSSSSDSDDDKKSKHAASVKAKVEDEKPSARDAVKSKIFRLFGREKPVHKNGTGRKGGGAKMPSDENKEEEEEDGEVIILCSMDVERVVSGESCWLGCGLVKNAADVLLWRNKKISASVLAGATVLWVFFELLEYHLITLVCHLLILSLAVFYLWSNASNFINKSQPQIPRVQIPEKTVLELASALRIELNKGFYVLRDIASGRDLKAFLGVIAVLWILSVVGKWFNFLTLFYIIFVLLHTLPVIYEKYDDQIDAFGEKAWIEIKKQYAVFDAKVLSKIPKGPVKENKKD